jgi:hypothetical protein
MNVYHFDEVTDPKEYLLSQRDKLIGCLIRGDSPDKYLLCIATADAGPYYEDMDSRGHSALLIYNPGWGEIWTSVSASDIERSLDYLRPRMTKYELNELFGHDGPSSELEGHISKLLAALPPNAYECRTDRKSRTCTVSDARKIIGNIVARYSSEKPLRVLATDGERWINGQKSERWLAELSRQGDLDGATQYVLMTGDGHTNPVTRIAPIRNRRSGEYAVGIWFDSMIELRE